MGVEVLLHEFLPSALDGGEWSDSRVGSFTSRESELNRRQSGPPEQMCTVGTGRYPLSLTGLEPWLNPLSDFDEAGSNQIGKGKENSHLIVNSFTNEPHAGNGVRNMSCRGI